MYFTAPYLPQTAFCLRFEVIIYRLGKIVKRGAQGQNVRARTQRGGKKSIGGEAAGIGKKVEEKKRAGTDAAKHYVKKQTHQAGLCGGAKGLLDAVKHAERKTGVKEG